MIPKEDLLFMVSEAVKAPSGHNTQPWLFKINDTSIEIHPNFEKSLPIVDPDNRELFISLGCAIENLQITASVKGYDSDLSISEDGITTISLFMRDERSNLKLFYSQIDIRQTNKSIYKGITIDEVAIKELYSVEGDINTILYCYKNGSAEFATITDYILKGNTIQMCDNSFLNELKSWMRYNKREATSSCDGLSYATFGAPNLPRWISKSIISYCLNDKMQNKGDSKKISSSSHLAMFTLKANSQTAWICFGKYLQRFMLHCTQAGISCAFMNQPCEIKELSESLACSLNIQPEYPTIILRLGYANLMPYSLRKNNGFLI